MPRCKFVQIESRESIDPAGPTSLTFVVAPRTYAHRRAVICLSNLHGQDLTKAETYNHMYGVAVGD